MKLTHIYLAVIGLLMYNVFLIHRDKNMFEAYDLTCSQLPKGHPDCIFAKDK